jgi:hypothetical protein
MPAAPYHPRRIAASASLIVALGLLAACAGKATPAALTATAAVPATSVAATGCPGRYWRDGQRHDGASQHSAGGGVGRRRYCRGG